MTGLEVRALCKSFGGLKVAQNIDFDLPPGARKALIGPNGAGKSTFFNCLTGDLPPTSGSVHFAGADVTKEPPEARARSSP